MLNDFTFEALKRRLPSKVTFVTVLRHMCWTFSVRLWLFCYLFIMLGNWENTFRKLNGYVVLKRKCYPLYMRKTCWPVFVVTKIPVSFNLPTQGSPPQCQHVIYAPGLIHHRYVVPDSIILLILFVTHE